MSTHLCRRAVGWHFVDLHCSIGDRKAVLHLRLTHTKLLGSKFRGGRGRRGLPLDLVELDVDLCDSTQGPPLSAVPLLTAKGQLQRTVATINGNDLSLLPGLREHMVGGGPRVRSEGFGHSLLVCNHHHRSDGHVPHATISCEGCSRGLGRRKGRVWVGRAGGGVGRPPDGPRKVPPRGADEVPLALTEDTGLDDNLAVCGFSRHLAVEPRHHPPSPLVRHLHIVTHLQVMSWTVTTLWDGVPVLTEQAHPLLSPSHPTMPCRSQTQGSWHCHRCSTSCSRPTRQVARDNMRARRSNMPHVALSSISLVKPRYLY
eukprot:Sspe_Gene.41052::Locus_19845_Transcript_1_1_Confidence_1.000_Length_2310::g.41052::m.41052